jgi:translocation and assembly module TamB
VTFSPGGRVRLEELHAEGYSGALSAKAEAQLGRHGLKSARGDIIIAKNKAIPLTMEGVFVGDVWGRVMFNAAGDDAGNVDVSVRVPRLRVILPESSDFELQSLEPPEHIVVGTFVPGSGFVRLDPPEDSSDKPSSPAKIKVKLGNDVRILRGRQAEIQLTGEVTAILADELRLLGTIRVDDGYIDVFGKSFEVERGVVDFTGREPENPLITASARLESPSGYVIHATYRGPAKSGKLSLSAEPALSQDQIFNVLLFNEPESSLGGDSEGGGGVAGGVATTLAARGVSEALSDLTNLDLSARVDTTDSDAPRPEIAVRVSPRLSVEVAYNPTHSELSRTPDRALITLDWQLAPRWSVATTVGDRGTSVLELIWSYRY